MAKRSRKSQSVSESQNSLFHVSKEAKPGQKTSLPPLEDMLESDATFSDCRFYRWTLWRKWNAGKTKGTIAWIGLNPSTADEINNDPTVTRCIKRSQVLGFGSMYMLNAFAYRATDPKVMKQQTDPIGVMNDQAILEVASKADMVVACWGTHAALLDRNNQLLALLKKQGIKVHCLGITNHGYPKHPLYLSYDLQPVEL